MHSDHVIWAHTHTHTPTQTQTQTHELTRGEYKNSIVVNMEQERDKNVTFSLT